MKFKSRTGSNRVISVDKIINDGWATVAVDVNRMADAIARNEITDEVKSEIRRLKTVIVDGKLHDEVEKGCGREKLLLVLRMARRLNENNKMVVKSHSKKEKKSDDEKEKLNNALRKKWVSKFRAMYGLNGKYDMPEKEYNSMLTAASYLDYTQLMDSTQTHVHFWKAFEACEEKAKQVRAQGKRKKTKDQPWRPHGKSRGDNSQITTKDFITLRIGRN